DLRLQWRFRGHAPLAMDTAPARHAARRRLCAAEGVFPRLPNPVRADGHDVRLPHRAALRVLPQGTSAGGPVPDAHDHARVAKPPEPDATPFLIGQIRAHRHTVLHDRDRPGDHWLAAVLAKPGSVGADSVLWIGGV